MLRILRALGLHRCSATKIPDHLYIPGVYRGLKIELDETPVGVYLEFEEPSRRH